jgi:hypothetical protein
MISAIRLSPAVNSFSCTSYDLTVEGLNQAEARSMSQFGQDLMLGKPDVIAAEVGLDTPRRNPLAELDDYGQKAAALVAKIHMDVFNNKITTIKLIRSLFPGMGLKESKDFVDFVSASCTIVGNQLSTAPFSWRPDWLKF